MDLLKKAFVVLPLLPLASIAQPINSVPASAIVQVVNGFVVGIDIANPGFGYELPPHIRFVGGDPDEPASASATVADGSVISINIANAGSGYKTVPDLKMLFTGPAMPPSLKIAVSALESTAPASERPMAAVATPVILNGFLVDAKIISGGRGYITAPFVSVLDRSGSGALASTTIENGAVTDIRFVKAGLGYSEHALVKISPPPPNPDATPRVTEVELAMQLRFPNNYYVIEASSDLVDWEQIVEPFFAEETTHTVKVALGDSDMRYFRAVQLP